MSILTQQEIADIFATCHNGLAYPQDFHCGPAAMRQTEGRAIEAAVIRKLATVGVEPSAWELRKGKTDRVLMELTNNPSRENDWVCVGNESVPLFSPQALAAARAQDISVLKQVLEALEKSYDVTEWPANGRSRQDAAIAAIHAIGIR